MRLYHRSFVGFLNLQDLSLAMSPLLPFVMGVTHETKFEKSGAT